jgi:hypothetical protein
VTNGRLEKLTYSWKAFDDPAAFTEKMLLYPCCCVKRQAILVDLDNGQD